MANGVLDTDADEVKRLENLLAQLQLGIQRTSGQEGMGDMLANLTQQQTAAQQQLAQLTGGPGAGAQATQQGITMANQLRDVPFGGGQPPAPAPQPQASPQPQPGMFQQQQQPFQPSMTPEMMQQMYMAMAAGADDPSQIGQQYIKSMQYNDMLRNQYRLQQRGLTAAQMKRPVGGGYVNDQGNRVVPIWNPATGQIEEQELSRVQPDTIQIGDIRYQRNPFQTDPRAADYWMPAVDPATAGQQTGEFQEWQKVGAQRGAERASAMTLESELLKVHDLLVQGMQDSSFEGAVGPLDAWTGRLGAWAGTKEGVLGQRFEMISNALTRSSVADWKGAISNAELTFFKQSVPQRSSSPEVWRDWYANIYLPTLRFAAAKANGELPQTADMLTYVPGLSSYTEGQAPGMSAEDQALIEAARALQGSQ